MAKENLWWLQYSFEEMVDVANCISFAYSFTFHQILTSTLHVYLFAWRPKIGVGILGWKHFLFVVISGNNPLVYVSSLKYHVFLRRFGNDTNVIEGGLA